MNDIGFEHDLRVALAERANHELPRSLFQRIAELPRAESRPRFLGALKRRPFESVATVAVGGVGVMLVLVIGALLVLAYVPRENQGIGPGGGGRALSWDTGIARLEADSLTVEAGGRVFRPPPNADVRSDPGDSEYRSFEMTWFEHGAEMRLYVYFGANETTWWVDEIRTYDGGVPGEWIRYQAPELTAARGASFEGDADVTGRGPRGTGHLHIEALRLTAFAPGTGIQLQPGCRPAEVPNADVEPGEPDVSRLGISLGMEAMDAGARLSAAGICHEFRFQYWLSDHTGYSQVWCVPPPGSVHDVAMGSEGTLILFVDGPRGELPSNPEELVGC